MEQYEHEKKRLMRDDVPERIAQMLARIEEAEVMPSASDGMALLALVFENPYYFREVRISVLEGFSDCYLVAWERTAWQHEDGTTEIRKKAGEARSTGHTVAEAVAGALRGWSQWWQKNKQEGRGHGTV